MRFYEVRIHRTVLRVDYTCVRLWTNSSASRQYKAMPSAYLRMQALNVFQAKPALKASRQTISSQMAPPPSVQLNNHFQGVGKASALSRYEKDNGPNVTDRWTVVVKVDGRVVGSCDNPHKSAAIEEACAQAMRMLGIPLV
ncbi:hypothetical protein BC834DRAFT_850359 [Gloeopeniophorella convolvens]|nr:hypothetical protein BC834DRAFT_850359 [Gloeopeniophorella convolvens]